MICKAPVPNKVKNYLWRLARNILPSRCNLSKTGIQLDLNCPLCNDGVENADHMLMHCKFMKLALFSSQLGTHIPNGLHHHDWILHWLTNSEEIGAQLFVVILWKVWYARNQLIFKNVVLDPG